MKRKGDTRNKLRQREEGMEEEGKKKEWATEDIS